MNPAEKTKTVWTEPHRFKFYINHLRIIRCEPAASKRFDSSKKTLVLNTFCLRKQNWTIALHCTWVLHVLYVSHIIVAASIVAMLLLIHGVYSLVARSSVQVHQINHAYVQVPSAYAWFSWWACTDDLATNEYTRNRSAYAYPHFGCAYAQPKRSQFYMNHP